jgi:hypothetical protein
LLKGCDVARFCGTKMYKKRFTREFYAQVISKT